MKTVAKMVVAGVSTVALACGIGAGMAYADPPTPTPTPTATASPTPKAKPEHRKNWQGPRVNRLAVLRRALHGEVTLAGEQHRVVVFQRGPVEKVSDTSLTVKSADGYIATYVINADTKVRKSEDKASITEVKAGDKVLVVANKEGATLSAVRIRSAD
jgi:Cu/Ag efflux protein CusF